MIWFFHDLPNRNRILPGDKFTHKDFPRLGGVVKAKGDFLVYYARIPGKSYQALQNAGWELVGNRLHSPRDLEAEQQELIRRFLQNVHPFHSQTSCGKITPCS
jgi:hypothetical protein